MNYIGLVMVIIIIIAILKNKLTKQSFIHHADTIVFAMMMKNGNANDSMLD